MFGFSSGPSSLGYSTLIRDQNRVKIWPSSSGYNIKIRVNKRKFSFGYNTWIRDQNRVKEERTYCGAVVEHSCCCPLFPRPAYSLSTYADMLQSPSSIVLPTMHYELTGKHCFLLTLLFNNTEQTMHCMVYCVKEVKAKPM